MGDQHWREMFDSSWKREGTRFIQFLLDTGLDVNALNKFGKTMLSHAAECGNLHIAEFLVNIGADSNFENSDGSKPLHIAAQFGRKDVVKFFLDRGMSVDSRGENKWTPLHYLAAESDISSACRESCQELVHILVDRNADIDARDTKGRTPLLLAAEFKRKHLVELFIKVGADLESCDERQWTVLHHACREGWSGIVQTLVEGRCKIDLDVRNSDGRTPAILAAENYHEAIVKLLVQSGADVKSKFDWSEKTLLHQACEEGWLEVVKSIVRKGCDLNAKDGLGRTPLMLAADCNQLSVSEHLIECGADVESRDNEGRTVLHHACSRGWLEVVRSIVRKGYDLNAKDGWGNTPLMRAADRNQLSVTEHLIECGADVECRDNEGRTVLHHACSRGWLEVARSIVREGCDLNAKDRLGSTPLMWAADRNQLSVTEHLIECGADVECRDVCGWTVLHRASGRGWLDVVESLIKNGSDVNAQTDNHDTPLQIAIVCDKLKIVKHLLIAGADCNVVNMQGNSAFNYFAQRSPSLEVVILFLRSGAYFQTAGYAAVSNNNLLKERILQNAQLCTLAILNEFVNADLPKMYDIPSLSGMLPPIEKLESTCQSMEEDVAASFEYEIQTKGHCNVLNVRPIVLRRLCVLSLAKHYNS